jgi:hypothetical protein
MDVFGTMEDVEELIKAIHGRKMRIIFDLVLNHTSEYVFKKKKKKKISFFFVLVNIHGLLNLDHLVQIQNVIGIYGEMVNLVVFVQIIGKVYLMVPLGNMIKKLINIIYIYFLVKCLMLIGNVQNYDKNYIE